MDWNDLRVFLALVRTGSIRLAAIRLGLSHSTVARRIDALEKVLGARLFERSNAGFAITATGEEILDAAERMENEIHGMERRIVGRDQKLSGEIRITMLDILATHLLMPHLTEFSQAYPDIDLEVVMSYEPLDLSRREADVALRFTDRPPDHLVGRRLITLNFAAYGSVAYLRDHTLTADSGACWIGYGRHGAFPAWVRESDYPDLPAKGIYTSLLLQYEATRAGMGVGMLPCFLGDTDPDLRRLPPGIPKPGYDLWLLTHTDVRTTARLRVFTQYLAEVIESYRPLFEGRGAVQPPAGSA